MQIRSLLFVVLTLFGTLSAQTNPVPLLNQPLFPDSTSPGGKGFTLTVNGTGFVSNSVVKWNGLSRSTTFVSQAQLRATISASDIATATTAFVTVANPAPGGGTSNAEDFEVALPAPGVAVRHRAFNIGKDLVSTAVVDDVNRDGILDLIGQGQDASGEDTFILVALGKGDGTFRRPLATPVDPFAGAIATGDFNGDGKLDIAVVNATNSVAIFLGKGDGTFQPQLNFLTAIQSNSIVTGDFNGDGKLDLALPSGYDNAVCVLLGNGDGSFQHFIESSTGGVGPDQLVVGDFNQDGKLDVAVNEYGSGETTIMLGNGDGTFGYPNDMFASGEPMVGADLNGDGTLDLAMITYDSGASELQILFGNGDGSFQKAVIVATAPSGSQFTSLGVADVNADGILDLWAIDRTNYKPYDLAVLLGKGDGKFHQIVYQPLNDNCCYSIVAGDFNADGKIDWAGADGDSNGLQWNVALLQNPGVFEPPIVDFGIRLVGVKSPPTPVTLTNSGIPPLRISKISITGQNYADFGQSNNCPRNLLSKANCKIWVTFTPKQDGRDNPEQATLQVSENGPTGGQDVPLSGQGTVIKLTPSRLDFGKVRVGHSSKPQMVTLINTGGYTLNSIKVSFGGKDAADFSENDNCANGVPAGGQCNIRVRFAPTSKGSKAADLLVNSDYDSARPASLRGSGT